MDFNIKKTQQSTTGFESAETMHSMTGAYPLGKERACELHHPQLLQLKWRYSGTQIGGLRLPWLIPGQLPAPSTHTTTIS